MLYKKNYFYFWITALLILITGFFIYPAGLKTTVNFNDNYYVYINRDFTIFLTFVYAFMGATYWLYEKLDYRLNRFLTTLHSVIMIGGFIIYNILLWYTNYQQASATGAKAFSPPTDTNVDYIVFFFITLGIQPFYLLNLALGGSKKKKK